MPNNVCKLALTIYGIVDIALGLLDVHGGSGISGCRRICVYLPPLPEGIGQMASQFGVCFPCVLCVWGGDEDL
jgi:hypothetical protein